MPEIQLTEEALAVLINALVYLGRFHMFGPGDSHPQDTGGIGTKSALTDFINGRLFIAEAE